LYLHSNTYGITSVTSPWSHKQVSLSNENVYSYIMYNAWNCMSLVLTQSKLTNFRETTVYINVEYTSVYSYIFPNKCVLLQSKKQ
jgi:hypothetical protein